MECQWSILSQHEGFFVFQHCVYLSPLQDVKFEYLMLSLPSICSENLLHASRILSSARFFPLHLVGDVSSMLVWFLLQSPQSTWTAIILQGLQHAGTVIIDTVSLSPILHVCCSSMYCQSTSSSALSASNTASSTSEYSSVRCCFLDTVPGTRCSIDVLLSWRFRSLFSALYFVGRIYETWFFAWNGSTDSVWS